MNISYSWLKDYLKTDLNPDQISEILTSIGLEVDSLEKEEAIKGGLEGVVVGYVVECERHPDADKLSVTKVDVGRPELLQIVCGAPNVAAGQKVPVATVGTTLYSGDDEFKIKKSKIRGIESLGMICAEDELGLGHSHDGIMVLAPEAAVGTPAKEYFKLEDEYVFEIGLTPNRIDAASHYGIARDVAAYLKVNNIASSLEKPSVAAFKVDNTSNTIPVEVQNSEACPRYAGVTVSNVKVGPSPEWLQKKLRAIGINPKNNVVDITNFILHELGQPLHAFDAAKVAGSKIVVRTAPEGTPFTTLDGVERKLNENDLMICNGNEPMCIAGVFGGLDSGVTEETTSIFIESAYFNPIAVRKTARRHGLNTDSSFRFERGIDPNLTIYALQRAALLVKELAGGEISSEVIDVYPTPIENFSVEVSLDRMRKLIGKDIETETIKSILDALEIAIVEENGDQLLLNVPAFRVDVQREADVVEEVLRIYGYNNIEMPQQVRSTLSFEPRPEKDKLVNTASDLLSSNGFNEIMSNSLTKAGYYQGLTAYPEEKSVRIINPLSGDLSVMRQTLFFNGMEAISLNTSHRNTDLKLYEFGNVYSYNAEKANGDNHLRAYDENFHVALFVSGNRNTERWNTTVTPSDYFTLRASVELLLSRFGISLFDLKVEENTLDFIADGVTYLLNGKKFIEMGSVAKKFRNQFDVKNEVFFAEIRFDLLINLVRKSKISYKEIAKYQEVRRDLALLIDKKVTFAQLRDTAIQTEKKLLKKVGLFDVYEGNNLPEGKKSYALSFILQDETKTLTDQQIDRIMDNLIKAFDRSYGAQLR